MENGFGRTVETFWPSAEIFRLRMFRFFCHQTVLIAWLQVQTTLDIKAPAANGSPRCSNEQSHEQ
jgi:hypothetical protein